jgi:AmiR/NasT family two-component response regulator
MSFIAVIAYENPTFIDQTISMGAGATITTPIRFRLTLCDGVCFAPCSTTTADERSNRTTGEKMLGIRQVSEAKAILMRMHSIGEEQLMRFCAIRLWTNVLLSKRSHVR